MKSSNDSLQLCKFHYHGYCRGKNNCQNHHLEVTCLDGPSCQDNYCREVKRHPHYCRYFSASGFCKLDKKCSYTHTNFANEISHLKSQLEDLKVWIQQNMKENTSKPKSQVPGPEFPCSSCSKICKSQSGLKRHIQIRHVEKEVSKVRDPVLDDPEQVQEELNKQFQTTDNNINKPELDNSPSSPDSGYECILDNPTNWRKNRKKKELAFIIEEKLKSLYSKNNEDEEEEEDANPRRKYIVDLRTKKKYIYNNEERGIFRFTSNGDLAFTVFYNKFCDEIPSSQLGLQTMDSNNRVQYSNVEQIRSLDEEEQGDQEEVHGFQDELDADHQQSHQGADHDSDQGTDHEDDQGVVHVADQGHQYTDESGSEDPYPGQEEADYGQDTCSQNQDQHHGPGHQHQLHGRHQHGQHAAQQAANDSQHQDQLQDSDKSKGSYQDTIDSDEDEYSDDDKIINEIEDYFSST